MGRMVGGSGSPALGWKRCTEELRLMYSPGPFLVGHPHLRLRLWRLRDDMGRAGGLLAPLPLLELLPP